MVTREGELLEVTISQVCECLSLGTSFSLHLNSIPFLPKKKKEKEKRKDRQNYGKIEKIAMLPILLAYCLMSILMLDQLF